MTLLRRPLGDVLRRRRQRQGRTLREVSAEARVSLGYLSEVERGQKEASSELLAAICTALEAPLSEVLREVSDELVIAEGLPVPGTVQQPALAPVSVPMAAPARDRVVGRERIVIGPDRVGRRDHDGIAGPLPVVDVAA
jgi:transcriptional regulator with XRE-family HTH domain